MFTLLLLAATVAQDARGTQIIDRNRADRALPTAPALPVAPSLPTPSVAADRAAAQIAGIRFIGAKAPARVAAAARAFLGQRADKPTLTRLATALSAAYAGGDVALYTISIPSQDFAGGVVTIALTEGRIARAQVVATRADAYPLLRRRLTPMTAETPLSRATYERQSALIAAIPGLTAKTDITDPTANGALVMTVTPKQRRTKLTAGFSNRGVALLGDGQLDARGELYGAAVDGDMLSVSASAAVDLKRYRYGALGYTAPIGASGLSLSANAAYLETRPRGYPLLGMAKQAGVTLGYPLVRRTRQAVDLTLGIDGLNSDNAAFGNIFASERTRVARAAAGLVDARTTRSVSLSASLSQGIAGLGTRIGTPFAQAGFAKVTAAAAVNQAIGKRIVARLQASGQYSPDVLPAAERFAIGGEAIGRAFDTALVTGDTGGGALTELALRPLKSGKLAQSEVYAFGDYGGTRVNARPGLAREHYTLASAGAGVRARYATRAELGLEAARVLRSPYRGYGEDWRISVSWRVSS